MFGEEKMFSSSLSLEFLHMLIGLMVNCSFDLIHELVEVEMFGVDCNLIDQLSYFQLMMIINMSSVLDMFCDSYVLNNQSKLLALHCQLGQ